jgi:hypothetical protein
MAGALEYRDLRPEEIPAAVDVFIDGVADLARRYNLPPAVLDRDERIPEFEHTYQTGLTLALEWFGGPQHHFLRRTCSL